MRNKCIPPWYVAHFFLSYVFQSCPRPSSFSTVYMHFLSVRYTISLRRASNSHNIFGLYVFQEGIQNNFIYVSFSHRPSPHCATLSNFGPTWIVEKVDCVWRIEGRAITGGGNSNLYLIRHVCTLWVCFAVMKEMPIYPGGPRDSFLFLFCLRSAILKAIEVKHTKICCFT